MPKNVIWNKPETGVLCRLVPAYGDVSRPAGEDDDSFLERLILSSVPAGVESFVIDTEDVAVMSVLAERTFRGAWECVDGKPSVNMPKACAIHMGRIRQARIPEFNRLDVLFMKAVESGDTDAQAMIGAQKQLLRDIPQTFDLTSVSTPEALKDTWPAGLPVARE